MSNISVYVLYSGSAQCNLFIGEPTIQLDSRDRGYESDFIAFVKTKTKYLPLSEKTRIGDTLEAELTLTRKKWTPKVGKPLASLTYLYLESISDVPIRLLWSPKIFFSTFFTFMKPSGRNSFKLRRNND